VVNLGLESGDRSIQLVEGARLAFRESNQDAVALVAFQLDPKLDVATDASFVGRSGNIPFAWSITFYVLAGFFVVAFLYHKVILPFPTQDVAAVQEAGAGLLSSFVETFASFFKKKGIGTAIAFLLLFRFAEAQLVKLASPFLLDTREVGGLALTTGEVGFVYGTVGVLALTVGGLLGGFLAARNGLKYWLWPMVVAINIPNAVYVFLSFATPESLLTVNICVAIEQFGYGFGFTAYLLYMIFIADGPHKTAHYAICTGFMALGMMIPGMFSGWLQEIVGYPKFFVWILIATIPGFIASALIKIDPSFGKKADAEAPAAAEPEASASDDR
jgi:PAT family beta-lactamase induction signal transducer AmpG